MEFFLTEDNPLQLYLLIAVVFLSFNSLFLLLVKLLLPWRTMRLLKHWKIELKNRSKIPLLAQLQGLVINMTNTVTQGTPRLDDTFPVGISAARLLTIAASAEKGIRHPLAKALLAAAEDRGFQLEDFSAAHQIPGKGVEALMNRQTISIGSADFLAEQGVEIPAEQLTRADQLASKGHTIVYVAIGRFCRGFFTLTDPIKRNIAGAVSFLREIGVSVTVLTSTDRSTARSKSKQAGIQQTRANLDTMGKAKELLVLQTSGQVIGAAGRTMNFEAAMRSAHLSFAMEYSDQSVKDMADAVIHTFNIGTIASAVEICRLYGRKVKSAWLICLLFNLLLAIFTGYVIDLETIPYFAGFMPVGLAILFLILLLQNQFPLKY